jgi:hypothetical protein
MVVKVDYIEPSILMDLAFGMGNDPYDGLERFDRVQNLLWKKYSGTPTDVARIKHGYDLVGNRLWREDPVAAAYGKNCDKLYDADYRGKVEAHTASLAMLLPLRLVQPTNGVRASRF